MIVVKKNAHTTEEKEELPSIPMIEKNIFHGIIAEIPTIYFSDYSKMLDLILSGTNKAVSEVLIQMPSSEFNLTALQKNISDRTAALFKEVIEVRQDIENGGR